MIDYETFCRLRQLRDEQGLKISQIAAQLDLDPKTVANWIERATYQQRQEGTAPPSSTPSRGRSKPCWSVIPTRLNRSFSYYDSKAIAAATASSKTSSDKSGLCASRRI